MKSRLFLPVLAILALGTPLRAQPTTLVYDGFITSGGAGTYRNHVRLVASGAPMLEAVGFSPDRGWSGNTSHFHSRFGRELKHSLLEKTGRGSVGHWTYNGQRAVARLLAAPPAAKSGVYTLSLLHLAHENPITKKRGKDGHTTGFDGAFAMTGFVPAEPAVSGDGRGGNDGKAGLCVGYFQDDLRVFAGGKSFTILEHYKMGVTYLLMAEMTASKDGPEFIRAFWAADGDKALTPAAFNADNGGKGASVETWASPADLERFQLYASDPGLFPPQASVKDSEKTDFVTIDEVRLQDGPAVVPVRHLPSPTAAVAVEPLVAKKDLPEKLAAYWAFDEGAGETARDSVGKADGLLIGAAWVPDGRLGKALKFTKKQGPKYGPHFATMVSVPHKAAVDADLPWERHHKLTYTAWVRGEFKGCADIITKANGGRATERAFADLKGIGFSIAGTLEFELVNSINFPQPDMRIKVRGTQKVPGDGKWHHVAVTYDGSSKTSGVRFYVDGVAGEGFSFNFADLPKQPKELTGDVGTTSPYGIGGRDRNKAEDGVSAMACGLAMDGDIDEVGAFSYVLPPGYVIAIHALADLGHGLKDADALFELHRKKGSPVALGPKTWQYEPGGLKGPLGKVVPDGSSLTIRLADDGSGVRTK